MSTQRWNVGEYTITSVVEEQTDKIPVELFFSGQSGADTLAHPWLIPEFADERGRLRFRVQAFVVQGRGRCLVIDPCVGNGRRRENPYWNLRNYPFLEQLADAGLALNEVDTVVHTHLHADHVGWGTRLVDGAWTPTFASARYLYTTRELEFRRQSKSEAEDVYADAVAPVLAAGLADIVDENAQLGPGLRLEATPGHSPGHVSMWIESNGESALITGDIIHHPVQCAEPGWPHAFDDDPDVARATRARMLAHASERGALVLGTHFPNRPAGKIVAEGKAYRFVPLA
ncbi:MAG TPA: MBL fold metallo-hydrolase [Polyangiales bacterium]